MAEWHRNTIAKVQKGDTVVMYCKQEKIDDALKPSRIAGVFSAMSTVFTDNKRIFSTPKGMYEHENLPVTDYAYSNNNL